MADFDRVFIVVLDSVGAGEMPDADSYGDAGSNTLGHIAEKATGGLKIPNLQALGLANVLPLAGIPAVDAPRGSWGRMAELSKGKDTTVGHWELAGAVMEQPFPTYPDGFPPEVLEPFEAAIGRKTLGNYAASGTTIIADLGEEHMKTGSPIVYTSADSVFQIAAHEEIIPIDELYAICKTARGLLVGEHAVSRVIARPFVGEPGAFERTPRRHDYAVDPIGRTVLDEMVAHKLPTYGIGKIYDIFNGRGVQETVSTVSNDDGCEKTLEHLDRVEKGLVFVNLVDFDMKYGHRNDVDGYARALEAFDAYLPRIMEKMGEGDLLLITADHGCDPTTASTDHSREHVPLLAYHPGRETGIDLGLRESFADVAATIADNWGLPAPKAGKSFLEEIL